MNDVATLSTLLVPPLLCGELSATLVLQVHLPPPGPCAFNGLPIAATLCRCTPDRRRSGGHCSGLLWSAPLPQDDNVHRRSVIWGAVETRTGDNHFLLSTPLGLVFCFLASFSAPGWSCQSQRARLHVPSWIAILANSISCGDGDVVANECRDDRSQVPRGFVLISYSSPVTALVLRLANPRPIPTKLRRIHWPMSPRRCSRS